jgi:alpha(1,3/1,4) fucosyltransferase
VKRLLLPLFYCLVAPLSSLYAEKIVQCIANFPIDPEIYTQALKEHGYDGKVVVVDIKEYESDLLIRKGGFHRLLRRLNLDFPIRASVAENVEKIVFFNIWPKISKKYDLSRFPKDKLVLFMWEPKTVLENMYAENVQKCFSKIYTWDDSLVDNKTYFKFYYPVLSARIEEIPSFEEKKLCTLVASDLTSAYENELYSQRREAIRYFEREHEEGFEFYGRRWDPSQYKSYKGPTEDKIATIKNYRFSICYENTHGSKGYVTEKIFDCFAAGTVPIYWGASNVEEFIPLDCFIDRRDFSSMQQLHLFMKSMSKQTYEGYLDRIKGFLESDAAKKFTSTHLAESFYQAVAQNVSRL